MVGLKDLDDAMEVRRRVLLAFEASERESDAEEQKRLLTFVIIGGGPAGVELAGSLAELARYALARDFRHVTPCSARIILLEGTSRILHAYPEDLSIKATHQLKRLGVEVRTGNMVQDITENGVQLDGEFLSTFTVLWCAGVCSTPLTKTLNVELDRDGRVWLDRISLYLAIQMPLQLAISQHSQIRMVSRCRE